MAGLNTEIEALSKEIEKAQTDLTDLHRQLGNAAAPWHANINYAPSQTAFEELCALVSQKDQVDDKINTLQNALKSMSAGGEQMEKTKISMRNLDARFEVLKAMLGAVAIEAQSAGKLPARLDRFLSPMRDYEKKVSDLETKIEKLGPESRFLKPFYEKRLESLKKSLDSVFAQTGKKLYDSGDFREVPGERAQEILAEMEDIRLMKRNYKSTLKDQESIVDQAQGSLVSMGAYGEEGRKLRALQSEENHIMNKLVEKFIQYGRILAEGMEYWYDNNAPEELKACCSQIYNQEAYIEKKKNELEHLVMQQDIEIHEMKLSQLSEQMNHLNSQIMAIENQKAELQQKVDVELKAISDLKMKQNNLLNEK